MKKYRQPKAGTHDISVKETRNDNSPYYMQVQNTLEHMKKYYRGTIKNE